MRLPTARAVALFDEALEVLTTVALALEGADPPAEWEILPGLALEIVAMRTVLGGPLAMICCRCGRNYQAVGLLRCPTCD